MTDPYSSVVGPLALEGGTPLRTEPVPTWPSIPAEGIAAVSRVLESGDINYWTGTECREFEREFAQWTGAPYALAVANGTLALEIALRATGVRGGDEVVVPSRTFIATAGAVVALGAVPVIADIDPATNNVTPLTVARVLTPRTRAVIPVHLGGHPADVAAIRALTDQMGIAVVEDCAQAHGARVGGQHVGLAGHAGCFSFCQDKILPLGEGGMITFTDEALYQAAWSYRDHGRDYQLMHATARLQHSGPFRWMTTRFGTNARLGEMEGALGRVLLRHLEQYHAARTENAHRLAAGLADIPGIDVLPEPSVAVGAAVGAHTAYSQPTHAEHAYYRLYGLVDEGALADGWSRDRILDAINAEGIPVQYGSCALIGNELAFEAYGFPQPVALDGAREAHARSVAFFVHPTLTAEDIDDTIAAVAKVMAHAVGQLGCGVATHATGGDC